MINIYDSQLKDIIPGNIKTDPKVQAFCYAFDQQIKKMIDITKKIEIWSNLSNVDEKLLDHLAVELRTQYYSTSLPIEVKRDLIKNTLSWYERSGTVAAVEELMTTAFGEGSIKEWHEYDGRPHYFKIITENSSTVDANSAVFLSMLDAIKRKTAKLESIEVISEGLLNLKIGVFTCEHTRNIIREGQ